MIFYQQLIFKMSQLWKRSACPKFYISSQKVTHSLLVSFLPTLHRVSLFLFPIYCRQAVKPVRSQPVGRDRLGLRLPFRERLAQTEQSTKTQISVWLGEPAHLLFFFFFGVAVLRAWEEICLSES